MKYYFFTTPLTTVEWSVHNALSCILHNNAYGLIRLSSLERGVDRIGPFSY